jgi:hypothetical protein
MKTWLFCLAQCVALDCAAATLDVSQTAGAFLPQSAHLTDHWVGFGRSGGAATRDGFGSALLISLAERADTSPDRTPRLIRTLRAMRLAEGLSPGTVIVLSLIGASSTPATGDRITQAVLVSASGQGDQAVSLIGIGQLQRQRLVGADLPEGLPGFVRTAYLRVHSLASEPSQP